MTEYAAPIGTFGDLAFEVSDAKVLTYDDYKRESKSRYAKHDLINQRSVLEWLGTELEEISFKMTFTVSLNVNPAEETEKVRRMCLDGVADYLVLGNAVVGENMWIIESVSEAAIAWDNSGHILVSTVDVKMKEYVERLVEE